MARGEARGAAHLIRRAGPAAEAPRARVVPPFPMGAAVTGLVSAVVVGAVAGFVPALVALRVKVIDAIRF